MVVPIAADSCLVMSVHCRSDAKAPGSARPSPAAVLATAELGTGELGAEESDGAAGLATLLPTSAAGGPTERVDVHAPSERLIAAPTVTRELTRRRDGKMARFGGVKAGWSEAGADYLPGYRPVRAVAGLALASRLQ